MRVLTPLKYLSIIVVLLLSSTLIFSQTTGSIQGVVIDAGDKSPLIGAIIRIDNTRIAVETDVNGEFIIQNLEVGVYTVSASYTGYNTEKKTGIKVSVGERTKITFEMSSAGITTDTIVIPGERKIDINVSSKEIDEKTIKHTGIRGIDKIVGRTVGVITDERESELHFRGGRNNENVIIVDGVPTNNPFTGSSSAFVPNSLLKEIAVLTGGFGAEFGNALSGVVNVSTKGGTDVYSGSLEVISDIVAGDWIKTVSQGYNLYNITIGGPLIPVKGFNKALNFYGAVERQFLGVSNPSWIADELFEDGYIPDYHEQIWSFNGRLSVDMREINKSIPIRLRFGFLHTIDNARRFIQLYYKNNSFRNPLQEIKDYTVYGRLSHDVTQNFFYELQVNYFRSIDELGDVFFRDDLFAYGDTNRVPTLTSYFSPGQAQGNFIPRDNSTEGIFSGHWQVYNLYQKFDIKYWGFKVDATYSPLSKKYGDHEIKFGGEYRYHTLRKLELSPRFTAHNPIDTIINGVIQTRYNPQNLWFGRDVLLNSFGYDVKDQYGRSVVSQEDLDPKHPIIGAFYLRDKIDFDYFSVNLGLRFDYLDVNSSVLKDPYVLIDQNGVLLSENVYEKSKPSITFSPRLGFSFPVTDNTVFVANYGKFIQMPQLTYLYINKLAFQYFFTNSVQNVAENSSLKPEKLTSYEIGIKQRVGDNMSFGITAYYKETKDQIGITRIAGSSTVPNGYALYTNSDFSLSKGIDFYLSLRRLGSERIAVDIAYTLLYASGIGANASAKFSLANNPQGVLPKFAFPLDYDQRHTGTINVDYRFGGDEDVPKGFFGQILKYMGLNVLFSFNSGRPYTQRELPPDDDPFGNGGDALSNKNEAYWDWNFRFDVKLDKSFTIWKTTWTAYIYILNLFNTELINNVYGSTGRPDDNGFLNTPLGSTRNENYKKNWRDAIRVISNWGTPRQVRFGLSMSF
jgi:outer membrane receptor protein involved in Fe transport